jgi:hypothetical protein
MIVKSIKTKPVVQYLPSKYDVIVKGRGAFICPIDHPSDLVSNTNPARTSEVIKHNKKTGRFETLNTIYVKMKSDLRSVE